MQYNGKVWKFGNHIDTDVIIPAGYLHINDPEVLARHCFEAIRPNFSDIVHKGDIILAGKNFGCGSSREHAPIAIKASGISIVIAKAFARIFFRNAINIGLPLIEMPEIYEIVKEGDRLKVDLKMGFVLHPASGMKFKIRPYPTLLENIINAGGLMKYYKKHKGVV